MNDYIRFIRRFAACDILEYISKVSCDISANYKGEVKYEDVYCINKNKITKINFLITQWELLEASFNVIIYGNDYRSKKFTHNDFLQLMSLTKNNNMKLENADKFKEDDLISHIICLINQQIPYQNKMVLNNFQRFYHIMFTINKDKKYNQTRQVNYINFESKFFEITGIEMDKFILCYFSIVLLLCVEYKENILDLIDVIFPLVERYGISKNDIEKILKIQCRGYNFYRCGYSNSNILIGYPIVYSERFKDKYIIINYSALKVSLPTVLYWIIRNYYYERKSNGFTEYFGHCFEYYLSDFFGFYNIKATKIKEGSDKKPDWLLETNKYVFLIEQKSGLLPIDVKTNTAIKRLDVLKKYNDNNFFNAFNQLNSYAPSTSKTVIRMCLTLDNIYGLEEIQDIVLKKYEGFENYFLNWIICIDDFEKLFSLLVKDENKFDEIIERKIELEKSKDINGRSFNKLLNDFENDYIKTNLNYVEKLIKTLEEDKN